jgi:hypothetical protein
MTTPWPDGSLNLAEVEHVYKLKGDNRGLTAYSVHRVQLCAIERRTFNTQIDSVCAKFGNPYLKRALVVNSLKEFLKDNIKEINGTKAKLLNEALETARQLPALNMFIQGIIWLMFECGANSWLSTNDGPRKTPR